MQTHTQKGMKSWGGKDNVKSRAKRGDATSAPDKSLITSSKC